MADLEAVVADAKAAGVRGAAGPGGVPRWVDTAGRGSGPVGAEATLPPGLVVTPGVVTPAEEAEVLTFLAGDPRWIALSRRRVLQCGCWRQ